MSGLVLGEVLFSVTFGLLSHEAASDSQVSLLWAGYFCSDKFIGFAVALPAGCDGVGDDDGIAPMLYGPSGV